MEGSKDYFSLWFNTEEWPFWNLKGPYSGTAEVDSRIFTNAQQYTDQGRLKMVVNEAGPIIDFNFSYKMIVVSTWLGDKIYRLAGSEELQRIRVEIEGNDQKWEILNPLFRLDCIDESRSIFRRRHDRPKKGVRLRKYQSFNKLIIDPTKTNDHHIFWLEHWPKLVIDENMKKLLEENDIKEVSFEPLI